MSVVRTSQTHSDVPITIKNGLPILRRTSSSTSSSAGRNSTQQLPISGESQAIALVITAYPPAIIAPPFLDAQSPEMPPRSKESIVSGFVAKLQGRKKSSKSSSASSTLDVDTSDGKSGENETRTTVSSPVDQESGHGPIVQAYHTCVNNFRNYKNSLTGVKKAELKDIVQDDIIIIVMGSTGVGKTSFISAIAGKEAEWLHTDIGHSLSAGTSTVNCVKIPIPETKSSIVLVDTPGFDDPERTNAEILEIIAAWLEKSYRQKRLINGIVYLHRITDVRFDAGATATLNLFKQLCGGTVFGRVALTTSMWSEVAPHTLKQAEEKEQELMETQWKALLARKEPAIVSRFISTTEDEARDSAIDTVWKLIKHTHKREALLLQKELVDEEKSLPKTQAGKVAFSLEEMVVWQLKNVSNLLHKKKHQEGETSDDGAKKEQKSDVGA
ncbi:hypothetical protein CVT24_008050 [Panaeolus cyanescens]|uniref:EngC GTPase domain-containing protein n=1 Tax=Panaeolus cyanescens TaxID=181874 RepID=A0A409YQP6_9AGAR|nr:hypothetical protein CVT24_008050 [Panaeolus cyanescens]